MIILIKNFIRLLTFNDFCGILHTSIVFVFILNKTMWEYKRCDIKFKVYRELIEELNNEGQDGWEIIHYVEELPERYGSEFTAKILFKRLKPIPACI